MTVAGHGGRKSAIQRIQARGFEVSRMRAGPRSLAHVVEAHLDRGLPSVESCGSPAWREVVDRAHGFAADRIAALGGDPLPSQLAQICSAALAQSAALYFAGPLSGEAKNPVELAVYTGHAAKLGSHARQCDLAVLEIEDRTRAGGANRAPIADLLEAGDVGEGIPGDPVQ